jgi:tRNA A-37 threonylcarbamoyl transferase component Bud32
MTPADLQRIGASQAWRAHRVEVFHGTSRGSVLVKGQRARRAAWRFHLLNGMARATALPLLRAVPAHGGARAQQIEVARLRSLGAAGVAVPQVLHVDVDFFVQSYVQGKRLDVLLGKGGVEALEGWQRGLQGLVEVHARDQCLSQAFARNFIAGGGHMTMIDFEDNPLEVMPLEQAQARDWLAYLHSSARMLQALPAAHQGGAAELLRGAMARERAPVRRWVGDAARRLRWVQRLPGTDGRGWRRHVGILQSAVALMLAAETPGGTAPQDDKVIHARHH